VSAFPLLPLSLCVPRAKVKELTGNSARQKLKEKAGEPVEGIKWEIIGIEDSYHGDTMGAMDAASPNLFNEKVEWYEPKGMWFKPPRVFMKDGVYRTSWEKDSLHVTFSSLEEAFSQDRLSSPLYQSYARHIEDQIREGMASGRHFGGLIIEVPNPCCPIPPPLLCLFSQPFPFHNP